MNFGDLPILGAIAAGALAFFGKISWVVAIVIAAVFLFINYQINAPKG